ncbi:MAG: hypothetical protein KDC02_04360, partial [Flavobacteriales bacterium]|nr:hypothetical protein [Flavobacteriales bacterium]
PGEPKDQPQQGDAQEQQQRQARPDQISKQDAERMLDALQREEEDVQEKVRRELRPARRVPIEKDW